MAKTLDVALAYARRGWAIFPVHSINENGKCTCRKIDCSSAGKHPRTQNGSKDATVSEEVIRSWEEVFSDSNIGIKTGISSRIFVLDIDPKNLGHESFTLFEKENGPLPETATALTGLAANGERGQHRYFLMPEAYTVRNKVNILPGVDIRGEGGYIVAPPSRHASLVSYEWITPFNSDAFVIAEAPPFLLNLIEGPKKNESVSTDASALQEGSRNEGLFRLACSLRRKNLSEDNIETAIFSENKNRCSPPLTEEEVRSIVKSSGNYSSKSVRDKLNWSPPLLLPPLEVEVPSLPPEMIPDALRPWVSDVVERMQSSNEMLMAPILVLLSGMIGRRLAVKPKQRDDWKIIPNLWGGIVAPPSAMKTPAMKEGLRPLRRLEANAKERFNSEFAEYKKKCLENKDYDGPIPIRRRRLINDSTIEKLGEILNQNPNGVVVFRDELYGFLMAMEKPGRESDRQFYLESFNGDGAFTSDRIGRGTIDVAALCTSILGGIQPDRISSYFAETVKNGSSDDGFLSRFQLLVYPRRSTEWELVDRWPDRDAMDRAFAVFNRLDEIDFLAHGFEQGPYDDMPVARFNSEAQDLFYCWITKLEGRLRSGEIESPAFEAHLTKYKKLMPSLALIFHVIDFCDPNRRDEKSIKISLGAAQMAAAWCDFLEAHAKKIYSDALRPQITAAHALVKKITMGEIVNGMTVRNVYRKSWSQLTDAKIVRSALCLLEANKWIQVIEESPTGKGAPSEVIYINPYLIKPNVHDSV